MKEIIKIMKALSDETRLKIIEFLMDGPDCVCSITPHTQRKQSTVSIQLGKLESAGILESERKGRRIFYRIKDRRVIDILKVMKFKKTCCLCDINEDK